VFMRFVAHSSIQHAFRLRSRRSLSGLSAPAIHRTSFALASVVQTMSTSAEPKKLFFVYAPDYADSDALNRRLKVRQQHLDGVRPLIENEWSSKHRIEKWVHAHDANTVSPSGVAGALVTEQSLQPNADKQFLGSAFIIKAESLEEVRKRMEADVYWTENVVCESAHHRF